MKSSTIFSICVILSIFVGINAEPHAGSASVNVYDNVILITGGRITEPLCFNCPDDYTTVSNECSFYDAESGSFLDIECTPFVHPRVHHTAVVYNNNTYLFGGAGANNDIETYDGQSWTIVVPEDDGYSWTPKGDRPNGRYGHGAVVIGDNMYIFGGIDSKSGNALNDMWVFSFVNNEWSEFELENWIPQARAGFSFTLYNDKVYIFGGFDTSSPPKYFNDLWSFDSDLHTFKHIAGSTPSVVAPAPRAYHVAGVALNADSEPYFFVHGGYAPNKELNGTVVYYGDVWSHPIDDVEGAKWWKSNIAADATKPGERAQHSMVEIDGVFVIFSGVDSSRETLADSWTLNFNAASESKRQIVHTDPTGHSGDHDHSDPDPVDNTDNGHNGEEHGDYDPIHGHWTGHSTTHFRFLGLVASFSQNDCFEGYLFPYCVRDCSENDWCSGNGECLADGSCCCNEGYSGDKCESNVCIPYRGFSSELLNEILLPKSLESTYMKLDAISKKLETIRDLLPNIQTFDVSLTDIAEESYNFYQSCLVEDLSETTECFEDLVGCDMPCGTETFCLLNDICINNECVNGTWRDCSGEFAGNQCVNTWCDEVHGCMHSTVTCDDGDMCTEDTCDPTKGCVHKTITCGDEDCCTNDQCNPKTGMCEHKDKCEDMNPCTIDICSNDCKWASCEYELEECCYMSLGQTEDLTQSDGGARPLGDSLVLDSEHLWPIVYPDNANDQNIAKAMYWLRACDCELIYDIKIEDRPSQPFRVETGAHIYGVADESENAGVVYSLPLGKHKKGVWNFCESGVNPEQLRAGLFYVQIYFNTGNVRRNILFQSESVRNTAETFRG